MAIKRIVLTGGPCAGKTTALVRINEHFSALGYKVFTVPEVPTMITQAGWNYMTENHDFYYEGEKVILELQLALEDKIARMAQTCTEPCVIVCDRGAMDISAYISPEMWDELTSSCSTSSHDLRTGGRYDAVLHLVSAADGAEEFYTTANNAQRYEKADEAGLKIARELDRKVMQAWAGHPHLRVINNGTDFEHKMDRVIQEISSVLELPKPITSERKYVVEVVGALPESINIEITQTYLSAEPDNEVRLRRRNTNGSIINILTTRRSISPAEELVIERLIPDALYESMIRQADPTRNTIRKHRQSFIYSGQFFELDSYKDTLDGLLILETKGIQNHEELKLPACLKIVQDVTNNPAYFNHALALKK